MAKEFRRQTNYKEEVRKGPKTGTRVLDLLKFDGKGMMLRNLHKPLVKRHK